MHHPTVWAWITCPCQQDPDSDDSTTIYAFAKIEQTTATRMRIILPHKARIGTLLTAEIHEGSSNYAPPIIARVTRAELRPGVGWLTECERRPPIMDEMLGAAYFVSAL
jgi:hypothetical protein